MLTKTVQPKSFVHSDKRDWSDNQKFSLSNQINSIKRFCSSN